MCDGIHALLEKADRAVFCYNLQQQSELSTVIIAGKTAFTSNAMLFSPQNKVVEHSLILKFALTNKDSHMFIQKSTG
jgi:hypothetical protein